MENFEIVNFWKNVKPLLQTQLEYRSKMPTIWFFCDGFNFFSNFSILRFSKANLGRVTFFDEKAYLLDIKDPTSYKLL